MVKRREGSGRSASRRRRRRYVPRRKICPFCTDGVGEIDYKQADQLRGFLLAQGRIKACRKTGVCAKHQRRLAVAIKRARHIALLPYTAEHISGGP